MAPQNQCTSRTCQTKSATDQPGSARPAHHVTLGRIGQGGPVGLDPRDGVEVGHEAEVGSVHAATLRPRAGVIKHVVALRDGGSRGRKAP